MLMLKDGGAILTDEVTAKIIEFERMAKEIKAKEDELKEAILKEMEINGIVSIDRPEIRITYVAPTTRETFNSKAFRADFADLYDQYIDITPVKSSIRIKVK